jgi:hypothetical protein
MGHPRVVPRIELGDAREPLASGLGREATQSQGLPN